MADKPLDTEWELAWAKTYPGVGGPSFVIDKYGPTIVIDGDVVSVSEPCNAQDPATGTACSWPAGHRPFIEDVPPFGRGAEVAHSWARRGPGRFL